MARSELSPVELSLVGAFMDTLEQVLGDKPSAAQRVEAINAGVYFVVAAARACGVQALTAKSLRTAADLLDGAA